MIDLPKYLYALPEEVLDKGKFCVTLTGSKKPYSPIFKKYIGATDVGAFADIFELEPIIEKKQNYECLGLLIAGDMCAVDLDGHVRDGVISIEAQSIIKYFDSYTEISPSGKGIRILFKTASKFDRDKYYIKNTKLGIEFYVGSDQERNGGRMVRLSGDIISKSNKLREVDIEVFCKEYMQRPVALIKNERELKETPINPDKINAIYVNIYADQRLKAKIRREFASGSESDDDFHILTHICKYTDNYNEIKTVFERLSFFKTKSDAHKEKWNGKYSRLSIEAAYRAHCNQLSQKENSNKITNNPTADELNDLITDKYGAKLRKNLMTDRIEAKDLIIEGNVYDGFFSAKDNASAVQTELSRLGVTAGLGFIESKLKDVASRNTFHPLHELYLKLVDEGIEPADENLIYTYFIRHAYAEDTPLVREYTWHFMCGMVARPLGYLNSFDTAPILRGPAGCGKSTSLKVFVNLLLGAPYFKENLPIDIMRDARNYFYKVHGCWVAELEELKKGNVTSSNFQELNNLISSQAVTTDVKFGDTITVRSNCVFYLTCNNEYAIPPNFDNRRFFQINCGEGYERGNKKVLVCSEKEAKSIFMTLYKYVIQNAGTLDAIITNFLKSDEVWKYVKSLESVDEDKAELLLELYRPIEEDGKLMSRNKFKNMVVCGDETLLNYCYRKIVKRVELTKVLLDYEESDVSKGKMVKAGMKAATHIINFNSQLRFKNEKWIKTIRTIDGISCNIWLNEGPLRFNSSLILSLRKALGMEV